MTDHRQGDLFAGRLRYPKAPGYKELTTSREAANKFLRSAITLRRRIVAVLKTAGDLTPDECAAMLGESVLAIRPRFTELRIAGEIAATGERRKNASGMNAKVYRARKL